MAVVVGWFLLSWITAWKICSSCAQEDREQGYAPPPVFIPAPRIESVSAAQPVRV